MNEQQKGLIEAFTRSQAGFDAALARLPEAGFDWREEEDGWSVRQIIHHVSEDCNVYAFIIEQALATPGCKVVFGDFPGNDAWGESLNWNERTVGPALALMHAHRIWLAELVSSFPDRWDNEVSFYNDKGEELPGRSSVVKMMEMLTEHMQEHTETLKRIAEAKGL
jgi:hypothetical protein